MSTFQIVLLSIFGLFLLVGVLIFAGYGLGNKDSAKPEILIWGTVSEPTFSKLIVEMDKVQRGALKIRYIEKDPTTFETDFTNAVAESRGPDVVLLSQDRILADRNKLVPIPLTTLTDREVKDTFIAESNIFYTSRGYLAVPFIVDPLVMYWNRGIFQSAGVAKPPAFWDEIADLVPIFTKKDQAANILSSTISLGQFQNVAHAKEILSTLIFQAGNPITVLSGADDPTPDQVSVALTKKFTGVELPAQAATDFFIQFTDPVKPVYSWNASLPLSTNAFLGGNLAIYFGLASEFQSLKNKNPNLDFDVSLIPQPRNNATKITFGNITGLALVKDSANSNAAYDTIRILTGASSVGILSGLMHLPPVRRDLLATTTTDAALAVFNNAALQSQSWFDPNPIESTKILGTMIESIESGNLKIGDAIGSANTQLQHLIK